MFNGKMKAVTFSFDDGVTQDERFIKTLDKYNLKATFNINSGMFGKCGELSKNGNTATHNRYKKEEILEIYKNHEIAVHGYEHKRYHEIGLDEVIEDVNIDCQKLEELTGATMHGMAYPFGGPQYIGAVSEAVKANTTMKYARTTVVSLNFDLQEDLLAFRPTVHHSDWDNLFRLAEEFISLEPDSPKIFYIWGHTYELDWDNSWDKMEEFCKLISGRDDIYYGNNTEVLLGEY